jgi:hypothetical protein
LKLRFDSPGCVEWFGSEKWILGPSKFILGLTFRQRGVLAPVQRFLLGTRLLRTKAYLTQFDTLIPPIPYVLLSLQPISIPLKLHPSSKKGLSNQQYFHESPNTLLQFHHPYFSVQLLSSKTYHSPQSPSYQF